MSNKLYNIGAYGIPTATRLAVAKWRIDRLRWSSHAIAEARKLVNNGLVSPDSIPTTFSGDDEEWQLVEVETNQLEYPVKILVRRKVNAQWTLVLIIDDEANVRTCWANLNTDNHRTLDKSKFNCPL